AVLSASDTRAARKALVRSDSGHYSISDTRTQTLMTALALNFLAYKRQIAQKVGRKGKFICRTSNYSLSRSYRFFVLLLFRSMAPNPPKPAAAETTCNAASSSPSNNTLTPLLRNSARRSHKIRKILADMQIAVPPIGSERGLPSQREIQKEPPPGIRRRWLILQNTSSWRRRMPPVTWSTVRPYPNLNSTMPPLLT